MIRRFAPYIALFAVLLVVARCGSEEFSWNQKVTVTVETPQGERSGSSVQKIWGSRMKKRVFVEGSSATLQVREGEAVVVDLGQGRYLFALLRGETWKGNATDLFPSLVAPDFGAETHEAMSASTKVPIGQRFDLTGDLRPMLVMFADMADLKTVAKVDADNLAATFGPGYRLKSMMVEKTDQPPTEGAVLALLPSLLNVLQLDGQNFLTIHTKYPFANELYRSNFVVTRKR